MIPVQPSGRLPATKANHFESSLKNIYNSRRSLHSAISFTSHQLGYKLGTTCTPSFIAGKQIRKLLVLSCRYADAGGKCPAQVKATPVSIEKPEGKWKIVSFVSKHSHRGTNLGIWKAPIDRKPKAQVERVKVDARRTRRSVVESSKTDESLVKDESVVKDVGAMEEAKGRWLKGTMLKTFAKLYGKQSGDHTFDSELPNVHEDLPFDTDEKPPSLTTNSPRYTGVCTKSATPRVDRTFA